MAKKGMISRAYVVPGLPHLVFADKLGGWHQLRDAYSEAAGRARKLKPDVFVVYSSQWISVLGHSFQTRPKLEGLHVDENWYGFGDLPYSLKIAAKLGEKMAEKAKQKQLATKLINFDAFPLDTGTIVSQNFFNPGGKVPVAVVSCNVYADYAASMKLGQATAEAVRDMGLNAVAIACTGFSGRYFTQDIKAAEDHISSAKDDKWNQRILGMAASGKNKAIVEASGDFAKEAMADMGFKAFSWLMGVLGTPRKKADVIGYGPIWGTGAAVVEYDMA